MGRIVIEDLDESTIERLKSKARSAGRSVEDEIKAILSRDLPREISREDRDARVARFAALRAMTPEDVLQADSTDMIREMRDRGYADY